MTATNGWLWYLGSTDGGSAEAPDGMVVFGFGRGPGTTPQLEGAGRRFTIGLLEKTADSATDLASIQQSIESVLRDESRTAE